MRRRVSVLCLLLLGLACQNEALLRPSGNVALVPSRSADGSRLRPEEAAFAKLADLVPSSAGFFLESDGRLVVPVRDLLDLALVQSATAQVLEQERIHDFRVRSAAVVIRKAEYSFHDLAKWRDLAFEHALLAEDGVASLDLDERANRVSIGLSRSFYDRQRTTLPGILHGVGVDTAAVIYRAFDLKQRSVKREREGAIPAAILRRSVGSNLSSLMDTLMGGIEIRSAIWTCSLGTVVDRSGVRGVVTASHCSEEEWILDEGPLYQPTTSRLIGAEAVDPVPWLCGFLWFDECRNSDASFFSLSTGIQSYRGLIARTQSSAGPNSGSGSVTIDQNRPYFFIGAVDVPSGLTGGQFIHKMGRTTGWTWGEITRTCVDHNNHDWPNTKVTVCGYESDMTTDDGDSGGPVFALWGNGVSQVGDFVTLVGLVTGESETAGHMILSKWSRVVTDLGSLDATRSATLSQPSLTGGMVFTFPNISWAAVSGATRYNIYREKNGTIETLGTTTSTSFADGDSNVLEYTGASAPGSGVKIKYSIYAVNGTDVSPVSNAIWYKGASGSFSVTVNGPSVVGPNSHTCSVWGAHVTGASTIVSYSWTGHFTSSDGAVGGTIPETGAEFQLLVVDDQGRQGGYIMQVAYDPENEDACVQ